MPSTGDDLSGVALAVALVALVISLVQASQTWFATAEGFRYCRRDVMGAWTALRQSRLDFSLGRFECKFVSPHYRLCKAENVFEKKSDRMFKDGDKKTDERDWQWPIGHSGLPSSSEPGFDLPVTRWQWLLKHLGLSKRQSKLVYDLPSARVSWLAFSASLEEYQQVLRSVTFHKWALQSRGSEDVEKNSSQPGLEAFFDHLGFKKGGTADEIQAEREKRATRDETMRKSSAADNWETSDVYPEELLVPVASKTLLSWDFMPPDVKKPFATISLGDLLVLGYRLGLDWTDVRPLEDRLVAQDDWGRDISASRIRGLGLVCQFQQDSRRNAGNVKRTFGVNDMTAPSKVADKLAFGIVPGDGQLGFDDMVLNTKEECLRVAEAVDEHKWYGTKDSQKILDQSMHSNEQDITGLDQILPLISPPVLLPGCTIAKVRQPNNWCHRGPLEVMEGYSTFRDHIIVQKKDAPSASRRQAMRFIHDHWLELEREKPFVWVAYRDQLSAIRLSNQTTEVHNSCTQEIKRRLSELRRKIDTAIDELKDGSKLVNDEEGGKKVMRYMLSRHLWRAFRLRTDERHVKATRDNVGDIPQDCSTFSLAPKWCAMMKIMFDDVDGLAINVLRRSMSVRDGNKLRDDQNALVRELKDLTGSIWYIWLFRALVWNRSCTFTWPTRLGAGGKRYDTIPAEWYDSRLPIHII